VIDSEGYRANVGIILCNPQGKLFWARRIGQQAWQFPQGGIRHDESPEQALYRELSEEIGLGREDVELLGSTRHWLRYRLPRELIRYHHQPVCIGQKQRWFLLQLLTNDSKVSLDTSEHPEFDRWRWVTSAEPVREVVPFKRQVYKRALEELGPLLKKVTLTLSAGRLA
jgi:putative (di)nucleoside polyphosphate hydrolase